MYVRTWQSADGKPWAEFVRTTYSPEKRRGVAKRIGRFRVDVVHSVEDTKAFRACTASEQVQARAWWAGVQAALGAAQEAREAEARSRRLQASPAALRAAVDDVEAGLAAGMIQDPEAIRIEVRRLQGALRRAGVSRAPGRL